MERQVAQTVVALEEHDAAIKEHAQRQKDAQSKESQNQDEDGNPPDPKRRRTAAETLASNGVEALAGADEALIDIDGKGGDDDQKHSQDETVGEKPLFDVAVQHGGEGEIADGPPQKGRRAEGAQRAGEGQDKGREKGGQHEGQSDLAQDTPAAGPKEFCRLLQAGVQGDQGP